MGRNPCCSKEQGLNKGAWTELEDKMLTDHIKLHGEGKWRNIPKLAGLKRCGKSCRLRWLNYLRPDIKRGNITHDEEDLIVRLHKLLGNRWSLIAGRLPGRTDNEIKNYWNTVLSKKTKPSHDYQKTKKSGVKCFEKTEVEAPPQKNDSGNFVNQETSAAAESDFSDDKSLSSGGEAEYLPDFAMDFNQLVGDIDLSEFLNADYSELESDVSLPESGGDRQLNLDAGFGSLELFLETADQDWMI